tara:strand:+ start:3386 stop:3817 length:432 start_codon:yes stop_codon:yes gene_type:complete
MNNRKETKYIVIHCSATKPTMDIGAYEIDRWHRERGWLEIGYHFVLKRNGIIELGRPMEAVGAHAKGYNDESISLCLIGGLNQKNKPEKNFTDEQWKALDNSLEFLKKIYPVAQIIGHNEISNKACPCFDVRNWLSEKESNYW